MFAVFFFYDTATTEIYTYCTTLSLHDALPILGMPVAFAIGLAGFSFFATGPMPMSIGVQQVASASQSFPLLAVPFFVLAGHMMNRTGITVQIGRAHV